MGLTQKQKTKYYKKTQMADKVILKNVKKKGHIIYGARAVNQRLPVYLKKPTEDYDILSTTPKKTAKRVEKKLDKKYGGNYFDTKPAMHPGTYKVINLVTKRGIADYTKPTNKVPYSKIKGIKYAKLSYQKDRIKQSLGDPKSKFRHEKDKETLQRIKIKESTKRKPRQKKQKFRLLNLNQKPNLFRGMKGGKI